MRKAIFLIVVMLIFTTTLVFAEEIRLTTIMPGGGPTRTKYLAIGDNYSTDLTTYPDTLFTTTATDLLVEGNVGIGTTSPNATLDVNGGVRVGNYATAARPSATSANTGTFIFDTTKGRPYVSNGTVWRPLDISGSITAFAKGTQTTWVLPTMYSDPDRNPIPPETGWVNQGAAYDGNTSTSSSSAVIQNGSYTTYLILLHPVILCDKIRFWTPFVYEVWDFKIWIDVYDVNSNSWVHIYYGAYPGAQWVEKNLDQSRYITQARIKFSFGGGGQASLSLSEFNFSSGSVIVTSPNHTLSNGDTVVIGGTTHYNGAYTIFGVTTDTFNIAAAWISDDATGTWTLE